MVPLDGKKTAIKRKIDWPDMCDAFIAWGILKVSSFHRKYKAKAKAKGMAKVCLSWRDLTHAFSLEERLD